MICNANDLSPQQRAALEALLGRPVKDGESVSIRAFEASPLSPQRKQEVADELRNYFASVDAARKAPSGVEPEEVMTEAMRSVRPGYRPRP